MEGDTPGEGREGVWGRWRCTQRARRNRLDTEGTACARGRTLNIQAMSSTRDVSRLSGWLNAVASCPESHGGTWRATRQASRAGGRGGGSGERSVHGGSWGHGTRGGAHMEHRVHVRYAGRVPARDVLVEGIQALEQTSHVCDRRDGPAGDRAVCAEGCSSVVVPHLDRSLQGGLGHKRRRRRYCARHSHRCGEYEHASPRHWPLGSRRQQQEAGGHSTCNGS